MSTLLTHAYNGTPIHQRKEDGYFNATKMCQSCGKLFANYKQLDRSGAFFKAVSTDIGIPITDLVHVKQGGKAQEQGTYVHPYIAINLAQWLSPEFAVLVSKWFYHWSSGSDRSLPITRKGGQVQPTPKKRVTLKLTSGDEIIFSVS